MHIQLILHLTFSFHYPKLPDCRGHIPPRHLIFPAPSLRPLALRARGAASTAWGAGWPLAPFTLRVAFLPIEGLGLQHAHQVQRGRVAKASRWGFLGLH